MSLSFLCMQEPRHCMEGPRGESYAHVYACKLSLHASLYIHATYIDQRQLSKHCCIPLSAISLHACRSLCIAWKDPEVSLHACVYTCRLPLHASLFIHLDQHQLSEHCCMCLPSMHAGVHAEWKNPEVSLTHVCIHANFSCLYASFFMQPRSIHIPWKDP